MSSRARCKWVRVFERCMGRSCDDTRDVAYLLETEKGAKTSIVSPETTSILAANFHGDDSAYFSGEESPGALDVTDSSEASDDCGVRGVLQESFTPGCHVNQTCEDSVQVNKDHQDLFASLCRISSIQDRSLRITRKRHQGVITNRRNRGQGEFKSDISESDDDPLKTETVSQRTKPFILNRVSSVQIRYWEIRKKRKDLLQKRRSRGIEGCPD